MGLTVRDMLCNLNLEHLLENASGTDALALDAFVEVHQQMNYPLKGTLANAKLVDGTVQLASGAASEYGDKDAWEEDDGEW